MNDDHGDALLAYAKGLLLVPEASAVTMTAVVKRARART
ncbi:MAG: DUF2470 domain-containing protein [Deltaproteobacteria bacterium]|nr:DUF2470 domain-containing protein [Deltaproteobacteria bacterium]